MSRKNKHTTIFIYVIFMILLISCEEFTEWETKPTGQYIIVDALITNESKNHSISVYSSVNKLNGSPSPISGANLKIIGNAQEFVFQENLLKPGEYISNESFGVAAGVDYRLVLEYNGIYDTATSEVVAITPIEPIIIIPFEENFRINYVESSAPSMMEVFYNWSSLPNYCSSYGYCYSSETFYTLNNIDVGSLFPPGKRIISFPEGTEIIRRKYSLNKEHQEFVRSLLLETEWRGGIFDLEPGNVKTNFKHGTLGWFGTSMVLADTTYF